MLKNHFYHLITILVVISLPLSSITQNYPDPANWHVERMPISDNLGSSGVKGLAEDHQGYLWFATNNGVAKYDGYTFKNYPSILGDSTTLNHNRTSFAYVDHFGVLWVGTRLGINRYLPECDCFKQYNKNDQTPYTVPDGEINWIAEDRDNRLWVVSQNGGLYQYEKETDTFRRYLYREEDSINISSFQARSLLCDKEGFIWVGTGEPFVPAITGDGLIRFNPETGEAKQYLHDPADEFSLIDNRVSALLQDSKERIWVGTCESGLHLYDPNKDRFIRMADDGNSSPNIYAPYAEMAPWSACPHIRVLYEDRWGGIWVGTYNGGIYRFDAKGGTPQHFVHNPDDVNSILNNQTWTFLEDSQGRFWLGNIEGELNKIEPWQKKFQVHFAGKGISAVFESPSEPNVIWLGIWQEGIYRWDRQNNQFQHFQQTNIQGDGPASNVIFRFFEDREQNLWIATEKGLNLYDRKKRVFIHYPIGSDENNNQTSVSLLSILEDQNGVFWLGSFGSGFYEFNKITGNYKKYAMPYLGGEEGNTYNQSIYAIHEDTKGQLWLGTWMEGLYLFDRKTGSFTRYLEGVGVRTIYEQSPGHFWLGTGNNGLVEFVPETSITRFFTTLDGLPGDKVFALLEDQNQALWMSTNKGLGKFVPKTNLFTVYNKKDGLPSYSFTDFSALRILDGTFLFGSYEGLISFKPEQILKNPFPPVMELNDVRVFNNSLLKGEVDSSLQTLQELPLHLEFSYDQNEFTFEYVGLHYTDPARIQYRHRLLPYEETWIEAGAKRSARYTNLSPGNYRFEVLASNSDGLWASIPAALDIRILPPWWQTWWAYVLYLTIAFLILYAIFTYQKRRWALKASLELEQEKSQRLAEMDEFKSRFYANITHEFRTPLTVIQGLTQQLRENPRWKTGEQLNLIERNSQKLLQLINQMLGLSKLEAGKLKPNYVQGDIIKYFSYLIESLHSLAFSQKITLSYNPQIEKLVMDYDPEKCQQIISNLISNAIKFTPVYGKISVMAKVLEQENQAKFLQVQIRDTGVGIPKEKLPYIFDRFFQVDDSTSRKAEGTGIGLALVKELLELMEGTISVESEVNRGTNFIFQLPVRNQAELTDNDLMLSMESQILNTAIPLGLKANKIENAPLILVVEDNQDVIYYLRSCLEHQYQIVEARNGQEGVNTAQETIPDLVISDVMMPEMDGFELCKVLKIDERTNHIPIILLTAKVTQQDKMKGLTHGADAYLTKPFQKEELLIRLEKLIELRRQLQQRYQGTNGKTEVPEDSFLQKVRNILEPKLQEPDFSVQELSKALGISRVQVYRKIKALTGYSIAQYIRLIRLNKAYELLKQSDLTIAEIGYEVGFKDPSHFSRTFSRHFGGSPSELRK